jgi:hypothetical protein
MMIITDDRSSIYDCLYIERLFVTIYIIGYIPVKKCGIVWPKPTMISSRIIGNVYTYFNLCSNLNAVVIL